MVWNAIFIKFIVIVVRLSVRANDSQAGRQSKWHANGNGMAIALMASSVSLYRHYADREQWEERDDRGEGGGMAHSCWSIAKSIINMSTHTYTHTHTGPVKRAKQIGGYYCHYNEYCYPFNAKWLPDMPESRQTLTFKCCRHCSQLTVRTEPHPSISVSSKLRTAGSVQRAAGSWCRPIKISARENKTEMPGKCYAKHLQWCEIFGIHIN